MVDTECCEDTEDVFFLGGELCCGVRLKQEAVMQQTLCYNWVSLLQTIREIIKVGNSLSFCL